MPLELPIMIVTVCIIVASLTIVIYDGNMFEVQATDRRHDIQHNDIQHNDTQHYDTQQYDTQHNNK
jgi:hypothetical protein